VRVIGVLDLRGGAAVRAYAGQRDRYQPIGDAVQIARRYVEEYRLTELYVADLDAIENRGGPERAALQIAHVARPFQGREAGQGRDVIRRIADLGVPLWLDAGVSSVDLARLALDLGAAHVVVGLETLPTFDVLEAICAAIGGARVAFSLDLRNGEPVAGAGIPREAPEQLAARAAEAGAGSVVVIDLARVGTRTGLDVELLARVRKAVPRLGLIAGGGVRSAQDLEKLAGAGCDGALVATALDALFPASRARHLPL
jgi:phosphoribosylformimino-5-aminoimidazole carboxamide ribotide isomerase